MGRIYKSKRLMVVDDEISKDESQKAAMRMSKPAGTGMSIIDTNTAITNFAAGKYDSHNVFFDCFAILKTLVDLV